MYIFLRKTFKSSQDKYNPQTLVASTNMKTQYHVTFHQPLQQPFTKLSVKFLNGHHQHNRNFDTLKKYILLKFI